MSFGSKASATVITRRDSGFTLVEMFALAVVVGLLAAITVPHFVHARSLSDQNGCINNLRKIDAAKEQWAIDFQQIPSAVPTLVNIQLYLDRHRKNAVLPVCPRDRPGTFDSSYQINGLTFAPGCRINSTNHVLL